MDRRPDSRPDNGPDLSRTDLDTDLDNVLDSDLDMVPLSEAANRMGISQDALRKRIQRGQVAGQKVDGRWYVVLDSDLDKDLDTSRTEADSGPDLSSTGELARARQEAAVARAEVRRLEAHVSDLRERLDRQERLLLAALQRDRPQLPGRDEAEQRTVSLPAEARRRMEERRQAVPSWWHRAGRTLRDLMTGRGGQD